MIFRGGFCIRKPLVTAGLPFVTIIFAPVHRGRAKLLQNTGVIDNRPATTGSRTPKAGREVLVKLFASRRSFTER